MIKMLWSTKYFFICWVSDWWTQEQKALNNNAVFNLLLPLYICLPFHSLLVLILELQHSLNKGEVPAATGNLSYLKPQPPSSMAVQQYFPFPLCLKLLLSQESLALLCCLIWKIIKKLLNKGFQHKYQHFRLHIRKIILFIPLILFWLIMYDYFATWWVISLSLIGATDPEQSNETR